jgi:hypothetical protein
MAFLLGVHFLTIFTMNFVTALKSALLGMDEYSLVVEPGHDCALMLALLVCMDKLRRKSNSSGNN